MNPEDFAQIIENVKDDISKAEEFLIMPPVKQFVIVGNLDYDACFMVVSGYLSGRFAYNFAGQGLNAYPFSSIEQANKIIEQERLTNRYPTVFAMDRNEYIKGYIERQKTHLSFFTENMKPE